MSKVDLAHPHGWLRYSPAISHTFIFIHGLFSNINDCWTDRRTQTFWPGLVASDPRLGTPNVFLVEYHTRLSSGDYGIADCARAVMDQLTRPAMDGRLPPISQSRLIFVGHSMGGIVCRYLLESNRSAFEHKELGLVLVASPSIGSDYATAVLAMPRLVLLRQVRELAASSSLLRDLDTRFKDAVFGPRKWLNLKGAEAVEQSGPIFGARAIVNRESAGRYFGAPTVIPGTKHSSICKPDSHDHPSHEFIVSYYDYSFGSDRVKQQAPAVASGRLTVVNESKVLFDVYYRENEPYYLGRPFDTLFDRAINIKSVWLYGKSGVGKTSIIRRFLDQAKSLPIQVDLSSCSPNITADEVIDEICASAGIQVEGVSARQRLVAAANALTLRSEQTAVVLYVDEVPVVDGINTATAAVVRALAGLLTSAKALSRDGSLRIVVSSIDKPALTETPNLSKFVEHLAILEVPDWTEAELTDLSGLITQNLCILPLAEHELNLLVKTVKGLPRKLKDFFRCMQHRHLRVHSHTNQAMIRIERDARALRRKLLLGCFVFGVFIFFCHCLLSVCRALPIGRTKTELMVRLLD